MSADILTREQKNLENNEKRELKKWEKDWIKSHPKPFYIFLVNNRSTVRCQFFNPKTNKIEIVSRSIREYGLKLARDEVFQEFKKRTGYREKMVPLQELAEKKRQEHNIKEQNVVYYKDIMKDIPLQEWFDIQTGFSFVFLAKSKSGKTTLLQKLYLEILKPIFPITFLSSGSINADIYKPFAKTIKLSSFNPKIIKQAYTINKHTKGKYKFLFLVDDMSKEDRVEDIMASMILRQRNYNISSGFLCQDMTLITPSMRSNVNYFFIGNIAGERLDYVISLLYPYLAKENQPKNVNMNYITKVIKHATRDWGFLVLDNLNQQLYLPDKCLHLI